MTVHQSQHAKGSVAPAPAGLPFIVQRAVTWFTGGALVARSQLCLQLGVARAVGQRWLDYDTLAGSSCYVAFTEQDRDLDRRYRQVLGRYKTTAGKASDFRLLVQSAVATAGHAAAANVCLADILLEPVIHAISSGTRVIFVEGAIPLLDAADLSATRRFNMQLITLTDTGATIVVLDDLEDRRHWQVWKRPPGLRLRLGLGTGPRELTLCATADPFTYGADAALLRMGEDGVFDRLPYPPYK